jgi:hypothetical protein
LRVPSFYTRCPSRAGHATMCAHVSLNVPFNFIARKANHAFDVRTG